MNLRLKPAGVSVLAHRLRWASAIHPHIDKEIA
jgi:hypothetical protein